ncbi:MAG: phosphopyruvate hydratase [Candidatus Altiarchaeales archaeon ex4484_96]|nr:MAG: phosphopyruvate hydratase [Candidatus Altiarchaeales archaeon ex4484_96]
MAYEITKTKARQVLDSRGNPTVEVEMSTDKSQVRAILPSGASTGIHEALELRDGNQNYHGKGVLRAVDNVNNIISREIAGMDCRNQKEIDNLMIELDGTVNKSKLGANAILGVSMCLTRASARELNIPLYERIGQLASNKRLILPTPSMNVINGGEHAGNKLDIQEYMILPTGAANFKQAVMMCSETYIELKDLLKRKYGMNSINVGDEGGFAPPLIKPEEPLELILEAVDELGYSKEIELGMDAAASSFYQNGKYLIGGEKISGSELGTLYERMLNKYPIVSLEDPFAEDDWYSWIRFTEYFKDKLQIVGDDLLVTNVERIRQAIDKKACNALLLKINQIGTITESIEAHSLASKNGWNTMVSHRSGETEDSYIADLVVGLGTGQIKSGAPCRSERNAKYNQLMRIEEELADKTAYQGRL